jgi:hypothetical protein
MWRISWSNSIIRWQDYRVTAPGLAESNFRHNRGLAARLDLSLCGRASRTGAFAALGLATNRAGGWLLDDVDHRGFDWHLHYLSSFRCLRRALFLGHWFRRDHARAPDLGLRFFRRRVLCRHLARRPGACLAAFRAFLARRDALFCFGHGYLAEACGRHHLNASHVALSPSDSPRGSDDAD